MRKSLLPFVASSLLMMPMTVITAQELDQVADGIRSGVMLQFAKTDQATLTAEGTQGGNQGINVVTDADSLLVGQGVYAPDSINLEMDRANNTAQGANLTRGQTAGLFQAVVTPEFNARQTGGSGNTQGGNVYMGH